MMEITAMNLPRYAGGREDFRIWMQELPGDYVEIGCGQGDMLAALKQAGRVHHGCVGVELDENAVERARNVFDTVYAEPIEKVINLLPMAGTIVLADVLEHLEDPWGALKILKMKLAQDGVVYASIPNVAYHEVSQRLFWNGEFAYTDTGILDRTHLRFFTKPGMEALFVQAGLRIKRMEGAMGTRTRMLNRMTFGRFEHLLVGQYFIEAVHT
ncbi:MAG: class I SAM-dependent methyltransferase [Mariprofundaceae bacterium]